MKCYPALSPCTRPPGQVKLCGGGGGGPIRPWSGAEQGPAVPIWSAWPAWLRPAWLQPAVPRAPLSWVVRCGRGKEAREAGARVVSGGMGCRRPGLPRLPPGDLLCRAAPTGRPVSTKSRAPWASSDRAQGAGAAFFHGKLPGMFLCNACPELLADPCFPFPPLLLPPPLHEAPRAGRPWGPGEAGVFPAATSGGPALPLCSTSSGATEAGHPPRATSQALTPEPGTWPPGPGQK